MSPPSDAAAKVSRYVTTIDVECAGTAGTESADVLLIFAGLFGRLIEVPAGYQQAAREVLRAPDLATSPKHIVLQRMFREQGVIIPEHFDELSHLQREHERAKSYSKSTLSLTICPTLSCNLRCGYCYQRHPVGTMGSDVQDRIVSYTKARCLPSEKLFVTWFGGEALLALEVIERLTDHLLALPVRYGASIITNGSLLSPRLSQRLLELHVTWAQITLDGPRAIHDTRRPMAGDRPSFDTIVGNMADADPALAITVRVNVDHSNGNGNAMVQLFDQLDAAGLRGRVSVYFAPVLPYAHLCADVTKNCMAGQPWAKLESTLQMLALERGYGAPGLPRARRNVCIADSAAGLVIVPSGLVFKCWNDVTHPARAVFDLASATCAPHMQENLSRWLQWKPHDYPDCKACTLLPVCMGGCPDLSISLGRGACGELKHNLRESILLYYLAHRRRQATAQLLDLLQPLMAEAR